MSIDWSNPKKVDISKGAGFLYFIRVRDGHGCEYRYVGKTKRGESRLREYLRNVERIFVGKPRRITAGQEKFRAVHLALAKAAKSGWGYDFYPLENVGSEDLNEVEQQRIIELDCALNVGKAWLVEDFARLCIEDLLQ